MSSDEYAAARGRRAMKSSFGTADIFSGKDAGLPQPPTAKPASGKAFALPCDYADVAPQGFIEMLERRKSRRRYADTPLTTAQLAFLLWATQGIKPGGGKGSFSFRTAPSAGARHPIETYVFANAVTGLPKGLYHYMPLSRELELLSEPQNQEEALTAACCGQAFAGYAPAVFFWTAVPSRSEWRYGQDGPRFSLIDAGHICQNLYLACEAAGLGACAIGAYLQDQADALLGLSPSEGAWDEEFVVYAACVGLPE